MTQSTPPTSATLRAARRDHSLAVILFMMALVFAPALVLHAAAMALEPQGAEIAAVSAARAPG